MSQLEEHLQSLIGHCTNIKEVVAELEKQGFEEIDDLKYLDAEKDLTGVLNLLQCRKLTAKLKPENSVSERKDIVSSSKEFGTNTAGTSPKAADRETTSTATETTRRSPFNGSNWAERFGIPWDKMHSSLLDSCSKNVRPIKSEQLHMVKVVGDKIWQEVKRPGKQNIEIIARRIVGKYPDSFRDDVPGLGVLGDGLDTLRNRLLNYIDNKNRQNGNSLRKKIYQPQGANLDENESKKRKASSTFLKDSYGCVNWQPSEYSEGENEESQECHRVWLTEEYSKEFQDQKKVQEVMELTFASQRMAINKAADNQTTVESLLRDWPYLKKRVYFLQHFKELMDFDLLQVMDEQTKNKSEEILEYALAKKKGKAFETGQELLAISDSLNNEAPRKTGVVLLLPYLLGETSGHEHLFVFREDTVTANDLQDQDSLPHPHIVIAGNHAFGSNCFVVIEGCVLAAGETFRLAVAVMFAAFYVFNICYPDDLVATLEFFQRVYAGINPMRGSKGTKKRTSVTTLLNALKDAHSKWSV